jgi:hypothetical protein
MLKPNYKRSGHKGHTEKLARQATADSKTIEFDVLPARWLNSKNRCQHPKRRLTHVSLKQTPSYQSYGSRTPLRKNRVGPPPLFRQTKNITKLNHYQYYMRINRAITTQNPRFRHTCGPNTRQDIYSLIVSHIADKNQEENIWIQTEEIDIYCH